MHLRTAPTTSTTEVPTWAVDSVTGQVMNCPVQVRGPCQHNVDKETCMGWFDQGNTTCPVCNGPLTSLSAKINKSLAERIEESLGKATTAASPQSPPPQKTLTNKRRHRNDSNNSDCSATTSTDMSETLASIDEDTSASFCCPISASTIKEEQEQEHEQTRRRRSLTYTVSDNNKNKTNNNNPSTNSLGSLVNKLKGKVKLNITAKKHKVPVLKKTTGKQ